MSYSFLRIFRVIFSIIKTIFHPFGHELQCLSYSFCCILPLLYNNRYVFGNKNNALSN